APFQFEGLARRALLEAKFRGVTAHLPPLATAAAGLVPADWQPEAVVPVPLAPRRERRRGFNQATETARVVAEALGAPLEERLVRRVRETPPQASLGLGGRATNLRGAFAATQRVPSRVLVVDDVTTTGATFEAIAHALRVAGSTYVAALALARED
ncbi:MAG: ComF family protein, partial [Dehalococcoidia bacterium]